MHMVGTVFIAAFGVTMALVLGLGFIFLRYQRIKHHYGLMQAAVDKGISTLPGGLPAWLVSLRQGVLVTVLGAGLVGVGGVLLSTVESMTLPPEVAAASQPAGVNQMPPPPPQGEFGRPGDGPQDGPPDGPRDGPPPRGGPGMSDRRPPEMRFPPREPPVVELWHWKQTQHRAGLLSVCVGGILVLLGLTRILFSRMERRYLSQP